MPLYLNLGYSYSYGALTGPGALPLEIVLYFEGDGFTFGRREVELPVPAGSRDGTESFNLGAYSRTGPPGNYRVYVYWEGQKIAEMAYEIDPDLETTNILGAVTGPNGEPLERIGLWAWQGDRPNSGFGRTGEDGTFHIRVPDGSFTLGIYTGSPSGCVGWFDGDRGITTRRAERAKVLVDGASVSGIEIVLPMQPADLPHIRC